MTKFTTIAVIALAGCASMPPPQSELTAAKADISAAEAVDSSDHPKAALHLKMARDNVARAEELIKADENESAKRRLVEAQADAELALSIAKAEKQRQAAQDELNKIQNLKAETN